MHAGDTQFDLAGHAPGPALERRLDGRRILAHHHIRQGHGQRIGAGWNLQQALEGAVHVEGLALVIHLPDAHRAGVGQGAVAALVLFGLAERVLQLGLGDRQLLRHLDIGRALFLGALLGVAQVNQVADHLVVIGAQAVLEALAADAVAHHMPDQGGRQPLQHQAIERAGADTLGVEHGVGGGDDADDGGLWGDGRTDADQFDSLFTLEVDPDEGNVETTLRQGFEHRLDSVADLDKSVLVGLFQNAVELDGIIPMGSGDEYPQRHVARGGILFLAENEGFVHTPPICRWACWNRAPYLRLLQSYRAQEYAESMLR